MSKLESTWKTVSQREKLEFSGSLLLSAAESRGEPSPANAGGGLTACALARIQLAQAIIAEALACGPGE